MHFCLSHKHQKLTQLILNEKYNKTWSFNLPVLILDRCWLRLDKLELKDLLIRLPPDLSHEAPEMLRYQELIKEGKPLILAAQQCWDEYGIECFYLALRNRWLKEDIGNNGWTYKKYMELINTYKNNVGKSLISIPLIILAYRDSNDNHKVVWIDRNSSCQLIDN